MLDDLAILQPENVDHRRAACTLRRNQVAVNGHKIALSDESLKLASGRKSAESPKAAGIPAGRVPKLRASRSGGL